MLLVPQARKNVANIHEIVWKRRRAIREGAGNGRVWVRGRGDKRDSWIKKIKKGP